jgi:hypothetical protein
MAKKSDTDKRILSVCQKLKKLRVKAGYTSYETFAFDNEIPRVQYWRLEKGANFTLKTLLKVLDIHGLTMSEFFKDLK